MKFSIVALILVALITVAGCSKGGGGSGGTSTQSLDKVDTVTMASGDRATYSIVVPEGASSLTIIADGGDASDMDISGILDPTDFLMSAYGCLSSPIGSNTTRCKGQRALAFTIPHSGDYAFNTGEWFFEIENFGHSFRVETPKEVSIYTIVKTGIGSVLDVNVWIVAMPDYAGVDDPNLAVMLNEFERLMNKAGISLGDVNIRELTGSEAERLTFPDMGIDSNGDQQPDDLDDLFRLSSRAGNDYLNLFFIRHMSGGIIGMAGGIPGIPLLQGTAHSGVVISTYGGLTQMLPRTLIEQGVTIAHEVGHYIGLFHPTEKYGTTFDPLSDTPQCDVATYDTDGDFIVSANECKNVDGPNFMFWSAASYVQETISSMQEKVMRLNPSVK